MLFLQTILENSSPYLLLYIPSNCTFPAIMHEVSNISTSLPILIFCSFDKSHFNGVNSVLWFPSAFY